jgi:hypothetical protein
MGRKSKAQLALEAIQKQVKAEPEFGGDNALEYVETETYQPVKDSPETNQSQGNIDGLDDWQPGETYPAGAEWPLQQTGSIGISQNAGGGQTNFGRNLSGPASTTTALDMSALPLNYKVTIPTGIFDGLFNISDPGDPGAFSAAGLKRVTEQQREADKTTYQEFKNYLLNITDGLGVMETGMSAAIAAAKLGQSAVKYATEREKINGLQWGYKAEQTKTLQAEQAYNGEVIKLNHSTQKNMVQAAIYNTQIGSLRADLQKEQEALKLKRAEIAKLIDAPVTY